jgi:L-fuculose-phosphate aldolase
MTTLGKAMQEETIFRQFHQVGRDLFQLGLISSHGGNLSIRHQGRLIITAHFSMLGRLEPPDLVEVSLREEPDHITSDASKDATLHQLIYRFTPAGAIIHTHPPYAVALSLDNSVIEPRDLEGRVLLGETAVITPESLAREAPQLLQVNRAIIVRGHGSYVVGRTLNEALAYTSALAFSCKVAYLASRTAGGAKEA